jgi:hypothetical protein
MKFETEYQVDALMQDASLRQYLIAIHFRPKLPLLMLFVILSTTVALTGHDLNPFIRWFLPGVCVLIALMWTKTYLEVIRMGRKRLSLSDRPTNYISFDDIRIEARNANEIKQYDWAKIEGLVETKDFYFLMSGKISLFCIPIVFLTPEAALYLKERIQKTA